MQESLVKAIIFDFGNVLGTNSNQIIFKVIADEFGIDYGMIKRVYFKLIPLAQMNQISKREFWKKMAKSLKIQDFNLLEIKWINVYKENVKMNIKLINFVRALKYYGYKIAILSNLANIYREITIKQEIEDLFDVVLYSCDIKSRKPEIVIFNIVIENLKVKADQCVYIDDDKNNLKTPFEMGMMIVLYESFQQFINKMSELLKISKSSF